jgi:hypothetical protein
LSGPTVFAFINADNSDTFFGQRQTQVGADLTAAAGN